MKRGDIWLVNLDPSIGHEYKKSRPAVIIQNNLGNKHSPITIIAPTTSKKLDRVYPVEVLLPKNITGQKTKVVLNHIRAVDKQRLIKKIGKVDGFIQEKIDEALKISIGLKKI
ncbi:MAG: type II toxin-antitoxin system PemK/MazF family toxin [Candidatus Nanoarchaeia archaeon]